MKFLAVHPSCLMYSKIYLRLEPLGLELIARSGAARRPHGSLDRFAMRAAAKFFTPGPALATGP